MEIFWPHELSFRNNHNYAHKQIALQLKMFSSLLRFYYKLTCSRPIHLVLAVIQSGKQTILIV